MSETNANMNGAKPPFTCFVQRDKAKLFAIYRRNFSQHINACIDALM